MAHSRSLTTARRNDRGLQHPSQLRASRAAHSCATDPTFMQSGLAVTTRSGTEACPGVSTHPPRTCARARVCVCCVRVL
eukprot:2373738-Prymnesium_polylepis.2